MRRVILLSTLAFAAACAEERKEYAGLEFDVISAPQPVSVEPDAITIVAGSAVLVSVTPLSSGRHYDENDLVALTPDDDAVFDVYAGGEDAREFVLVGLSPGRSCLEVRVERRREECIEVRVIAADE